ncbi:hypothetical protein KO02_16660 [Sphingobacterium sp. ML3W]|nr:hypothetical protein KO02_16660 [Sphingobacterium sp. ML3W]
MSPPRHVFEESTTGAGVALIDLKNNPGDIEREDQHQSEGEVQAQQHGLPKQQQTNNSNF